MKEILIKESLIVNAVRELSLRHEESGTVYKITKETAIGIAKEIINLIHRQQMMDYTDDIGQGAKVIVVAEDHESCFQFRSNDWIMKESGEFYAEIVKDTLKVRLSDKVIQKKQELPNEKSNGNKNS